MKIDFDMLEKMVAAGASGAVVLAFLREQDARKAPRRAADRTRKRNGKKRNVAESVRKTDDSATLTDTPRARLFREGKGALLTLNISNSRAGGLIAQWLKLTNDDDQLVLATILRAQELGAAEAPGWILETLKGKMNERSGSVRANTASGESRTASIVAGVAAATQRRFGGGGQGSVPGEAEPAREPDAELFRDG